MEHNGLCGFADLWNPKQIKERGGNLRECMPGLFPNLGKSLKFLGKGANSKDRKKQIAIYLRQGA